MHVMIDLETLSTANNAQILSIGAVKFDTLGIHDTFYQNIKLKSDSVFDISGTTVLWWLNQTKEAQETLLKKSLNLRDSLIKFSAWYYNYDMLRMKADDKVYIETGKEVWGNGATFDNVILRNAYKKLDLECPWSFRDDRCFRTMARQLEASLNKRQIDVTFDFNGTKHNALQDAKNQAEYLIHLCIIAQIKL